MSRISHSTDLSDPLNRAQEESGLASASSDEGDVGGSVSRIVDGERRTSIVVRVGSRVGVVGDVMLGVGSDERCFSRWVRIY